MRAIIIFLSLVLNSAMVYATETQNQIPTNFQGLWSSDLSLCHIDHEVNLRINSTDFKFWESSGSAIAIVTHGNNELASIVEFTGEGTKWISFVHFQLLADESKLIDIANPEPNNQLVRYRCP